MPGLRPPDNAPQKSGKVMKQRLDPRSRRSRQAIIDAFGRLVLRRQPRRIRAADVIAEAQVGRSTFYEHFSGAEQVHMAALRAPFAILADAAAGRGDVTRLEALLSHFWENRGRAREMLEGRSGEQALRMLAGLVEERLDEPLILPPAMAARQLAAAMLAPIGPWLFGEIASAPAALAAALCRSGEAMVRALRPA